MKRFVIEREIAAVGDSTRAQLAAIARTSNAALAELAPRVQWEHSYFTADKSFCIYLAEDVSDVRRHADLSGFPADHITEVCSIVDPTTAAAA